MLERALNLLVKKYECKECGHSFIHAPLLAPIVRPFIVIDPAPSPTPWFKKPCCPKCGSKNLKKIN